MKILFAAIAALIVLAAHSGLAQPTAISNLGKLKAGKAPVVTMTATNTLTGRAIEFKSIGNAAVRFPELRRELKQQELEAATRVATEGTPEARAEYLREVEHGRRIESLSRNTMQAPYSLWEYAQMERIMALSHIMATNRESIRAGVHYTVPGGIGGGYFRGDPNVVERLIPLARAALASTNRNETERFLEVYPIKKQNVTNARGVNAN